MANLELTSLSCTNCGASLSDFHGKSEVTCEYCNTNIRVLRPRQVSTTQGNLSNENFEKLNNYVEILQKAIRAGNYEEGYEYCNKALEINPNIGAIWENKAICAFWRSVSIINEDKITASNAREIRTFLSASKENDPNSDSYAATADAIGGNLATILRLKIAIIEVTEVVSNGKAAAVRKYSNSAINKLKDYLDTVETAYEIMVNKDIEILKYLVNEYSNHGKVKWFRPANQWSNNTDEKNLILDPSLKFANLDVKRKRDILIKKIKDIEPSFTPPQIKVESIGLGTKIFIVILAIVLFVATFWSLVVPNK